MINDTFETCIGIFLVLLILCVPAAMFMSYKKTEVQCETAKEITTEFIEEQRQDDEESSYMVGYHIIQIIKIAREKFKGAE